MVSYNKVPSPLLTMLPTTLSAIVTGIVYHYKRKPVSLELAGVNQLPMVAAIEAHVLWITGMYAGFSREGGLYNY